MNRTNETRRAKLQGGEYDNAERRAPLRPYLWMLGGALAFATMSAFAHALGERLDWKFVAAARALVPMVLSLLLCRMARVSLVFFKPWTLWWRSTAGSVSLVLAFYALTHLPVADVLTLTNLFPAWIALLSWPLTGVVPPLRFWLAIAVGICGVALVQQPHLAQGNVAVFAAIGSSFTSALALLGLHRLQDLDSRAIVFHFSGVAFLICLATIGLTPSTETRQIMWSGGLFVPLIGVGVAATIGQILLTKAFTQGNPAKVSVIGLSQVGFGAVFDWVVWHRIPTPIALVGMFLVVAPTAWLLLQGSRQGSH